MLLLAGLSLLPACCVSKAPPVLRQDVQMIWPTYMWNLQLKLGKTPEESEERRQRLVQLAEAGYHRYTETILPKELEVDATWRTAYEREDGEANQANLGFLRWQKAAFSKAKRRAVDELRWDGTPVPLYRQVSYDWAEFYASKDYKRLVKGINSKIVKYFGMATGQRGEDKYSIFPWIEVYRPGEHHPPIMRTGAPATAIFAAKLGGEQALTFVDERGYSPPHNKRHTVHLSQGELMITPAWATYYLSPNLGNSSNIFFRFWISMPQGVNDFDWEDDPLGSYVHVKQIRLKVGDEAPAKAAEPQTAAADRRGGEL